MTPLTIYDVKTTRTVRDPARCQTYGQSSSDGVCAVQRNLLYVKTVNGTRGALRCATVQYVRVER